MTASKIVRTSQPQGAVGIDWANPITRGLVFASNHAVDLRNVASNTTQPALVDSPQSSAYQAGRAYRFVNTPVQGINYGNASVLNPQKFTLFSQFRIDAALTPGEEYMLLSRDDATLGRAYVLSINGAGSVGLRAFINGTGAIYEGTQPSIGVPHTASYSLDSGTVALYRDGRQVASATGAGSVASTTGATMVGARTYSGYPSVMNGYIGLSLIWNRALSAIEIKSLSDNPWQIFEPIKKPIFVGVAEAAANEVSIGTVLEGIQLASSVGIITAESAGAILNASTTLTGQQANSNIGQLSTLTSVLAPITGSQASTVLGTLTARSSATTILQSLASSSSVGSISASNLDNGNIAIQGIQVTTTIGQLNVQAASTTSLLGRQAVSSVSAPIAKGGASKALVGVQANTSIGTVGAVTNTPGNGVLIGQPATSAVGQLTTSATRSANVTLSGVLANSSAGILTAKISVSTTPQGSQATGSVGILLANGTRSASTVLSGVSASTNKGTITAYTNVTISLNGIPVSTTVGTLQVTAGSRVTLPSVSSIISVGDITASGNFPYTVSLQYYYSEERNNVLVPDTKDNDLIPAARDTKVSNPESRANMLMVDSKDNTLTPDNRNSLLEPSKQRNVVFATIAKLTSFISPKER